MNVKRSEGKRTRESSPRGYWLGVAHRTCMLQAAIVKLVPWDTTELGKLPASVIQQAHAACHALVAEAVKREEVEGRTARPLIEQYINAGLWALFREHRPVDRKPTAPGATGVIRHLLPVGSIYDPHMQE